MNVKLAFRDVRMGPHYPGCSLSLLVMSWCAWAFNGACYYMCMRCERSVVTELYAQVCLNFSFALFDLILYAQSTIFQLNRDRSSWVEPVLS